MRVDAQLELRPLAAERPEAVSQPVVPPVLRGREADPRRPDQAVPDRESVTQVRIEPVAVGEARIFLSVQWIIEEAVSAGTCSDNHLRRNG